mgnify:CR=1 FL=1
MKILSVTISKKLFFIFLINSIITVTISGMVIYSFLGLSGQFNFNSELSNFKSILDSIRIEHRDDFEHELVAELGGGGVVTDKEVNHSLHHVGCIALPGVNPS